MDRLGRWENGGDMVEDLGLVLFETGNRRLRYIVGHLLHGVYDTALYHVRRAYISYVVETTEKMHHICYNV